MNNQLVKVQLKHTHTHFENPHGLPDKNQISTAFEIATASLFFLKNSVKELLFRYFSIYAVLSTIEAAIIRVKKCFNGLTPTY